MSWSDEVPRPHGRVVALRHDVDRLFAHHQLHPHVGGEAFGAFLANFQTVYHFNGEQTVTIDGDRATGTSYCLVTLIGDENGRRMQTTIGVIYNDDYVRENGRWLIARRRSVFDWEEKREVSR